MLEVKVGHVGAAAAELGLLATTFGVHHSTRFEDVEPEAAAAGRPTV